jgi:hypothetical protein
LASIARYAIKVAVNADGSDPKLLHVTAVKMIEGQGLKLNVARVEGDDVLETVKQKLKFGEIFENICTEETLKDWQFEPISAQAYLGGLGVAEGFQNGADIVTCGRISDASPVIGAAYWWHEWNRGKL